ncbi:TraR/DksA family transcriptional regulator [Actinocorallia longicatena]|uniref:TraR/DksA C4-type zinc finger protein n=1 Tax=Actinocorallia longicatena TaxID=111803 RepID=A0ABP6QKE2_9ACTN
MDDRERSTALREAASRQIQRARAETLRLISSLARQWDELVASTDLSNADDEHDPEGATIAFERARLSGSLARARTDLEALDRAVIRLEAGDYWFCERCGQPIAPARLDARPAARTCITCAT